MNRILPLLLSSLFCTFFQNLMAQEITGHQTAADDVLVIHLETDWINIRESERQTTYEDFKPSAAGWLVNGITPQAIGIHTTVTDEQKVLQIDYVNHFPIKMLHKIYLQLNEPLTTQSTYTVSSPYGSYAFTFDPNTTYCESIKVNQAGYNGNSTVRYANFGIFKGDLGPQLLSTAPHYSVKSVNTNSTVLSGVLTYWGDDTGNGRAQSGEHVYRIDLSNLSSGEYYIEVENIGRSYAFGVGASYAAHIASTHLRGMYHQRCGIALEEPYTKYERGICHHHVAHTRFPGNGQEGEGWIIANANEATHEIIGGYHDAGDYDRRIYHTVIPLLMLNYYEAFSDHFIDDQYNIPESGNGIPDFFDEALWGMKVWEYLQLNEENSSDSSAYGGVMGGTETSRHPTYGVDRADREGNDTMTYGTYDVYESTTIASAGFFAQAARLIAPYDNQKSTELQERALSAWNYCERHNLNAELGFRMYAALQLYLLTASGDTDQDMNNPYHETFRNLAQAHVVGNGSWPYQYLVGNGSAKILTSHFSSYLFTSFTVDNNLVDDLTARIKQQADQGGYMGWTPETYPYAQGATKFIAWGAGTSQGRYADAAAFMYKLSESAEDQQHYYNIVSQLGDYSLGLNPLSKSFVTGLGKDVVNSPAHLDSYWTKYGETPDGGTQAVLGNVPGIVVYGFTESRSGAYYQTAVSDHLYPEWDSLPGQRRWTDGWSLINSNEFTTWETMVWNTCMYAVLYNANTDVSTHLGGQPAHRLLEIYPNPCESQIRLSKLNPNLPYAYVIFDVSGKQIHSGEQINSVQINHLDRLSSGSYFIHVSQGNISYRGRFIKQ